MKTPNTAELLHLWECGIGQSAAIRGLLLMSAVVPTSDTDALARMSIGQRDVWLLNLREALFGSGVHGLMDCRSCGQPIELDFRIDEIRVAHGEPCESCHIDIDGHEIEFRLPDSNDLLALECDRTGEAERKLFERCVLCARSKDGDLTAAELPDHVLSEVSQRMAEADPQAEVLLQASCPTCSSVSQAPFDIGSHLWVELDAWARRLIQEIHLLAWAYGWSEAEIVRLSVTRRRAYLDLLARST